MSIKMPQCCQIWVLVCPARRVMLAIVPCREEQERGRAPTKPGRGVVGTTINEAGTTQKPALERLPQWACILLLCQGQLKLLLLLPLPFTSITCRSSPCDLVAGCLLPLHLHGKNPILSLNVGWMECGFCTAGCRISDTPWIHP